MWLNRLAVASLLVAQAATLQGPLTDQQVARAIDRADKQKSPYVLVRPVSAARTTVEWDNAIGVALNGQGLTATFDASMLPSGDLDLGHRRRGRVGAPLSADGISSRTDSLKDIERRWQGFGTGHSKAGG